jgi:alginate O-acetyltransferase complex protein AlgI
MSLTSGQFFAFFTVVFFLFWATAKHPRLRLALVVAANCLFLAKWSLAYLVLIPFCAGIDFALGAAIHQKTGHTRQALLSLSILMNLALILSARLPQLVPHTSWMLTISLSFFAFQALTYTIDIFRRDAKPTDSLLVYLASVSFFPTLLAGPITRVSKLVQQWQKGFPTISAETAGRAIFLIALGSVKKLLVADYLGNNLVNRVFDTPKLYSSAEVVAAVYGYAFQLYYDFSGYSDVAVGIGLLIGFRLPINFKSPYRAENIADFWRRWHISLSDWLRDYLFFSLPGQRSKNKWPIYANLIITMLIGGLWHGLSFNFLFWGALHGVALAVTRWWQSGDAPTTPWTVWLKRIGCFHFVCFSWIFFRAESWNAAWSLLQRIATFSGDTSNLTCAWLLILIIAAVAHFVPDDWLQSIEKLFVAAPAPLQAAMLMLLAVSIQKVVSSGVAPFIYSKF